MTWESRIIGHGVMDPHELIPNPKNWRTHPKLQEKALEGALEDIGWIQDVIVNERTGKLLDGHLRVELAKKRGEHKIPVVMVDLSEEEEELALITLDPITAMAEADKDRLSALLQSITSDNEKVNQLLEDIGREYKVSTKKAKEDDYTPPPEIETDIKRGDIFQLGRHRVMCGDSTSREDVDRLMQGKKADLLLTDPHYGVSYSEKNKYLNAIAPANRIQTPIENDSKTPEAMSAFWNEVFKTIRPVMNKGAVYYTTGPQGGDLLLLLLLSLKESGFPLRHMLVWAKNNHVLGRSDYHYKHEPIIYGWVEGTHKFYGHSGETSLWEIDKPHESKLHPTMKPIALFARAINNSTKPQQVVIDPFLGSGTTLIACEQLDRICYGMEISPQYCEVICQRWEKFTGQTRIKIGDLDT